MRRLESEAWLEDILSLSYLGWGYLWQLVDDHFKLFAAVPLEYGRDLDHRVEQIWQDPQCTPLALGVSVQVERRSADRVLAKHADSLSERLWSQAYDDLQADEPTLVSAYEKILSRELDDPTGPAGKAQNAIEKDRLARRAQMQRLIQAGLKKMEREANAKRRIGDTMDIVLSAKGIIQRLDEMFPFPKHENRAVCMRYLPHALTALEKEVHGSEHLRLTSSTMRVSNSPY